MSRDEHADLLDALEAIDPAGLSYQEWVDVGMALHESGFGWEDWDLWSRRDPARYHGGECERKWPSFGRGLERVGSGTIVAMARGAGWEPRSALPDEPMDWDSTATVIDPSWVEEKPLAPSEEAPADQLSAYLAALFDDDERVGYVCESWERDGRHMPTKGHWDRTAGELRRELDRSGDLGAVLGDWDDAAGAWIRFNPLDGKGCGNANVTEYRHALVESDTLPVEKQLGMIEAMNLPCAAVVSSGGKSVHAIVKVDAGTDYDLYRKRVERLYAYCRGHGFEPDTQNKNPSRLSRLPGATRNGAVQSLVAVGCGAESWQAWEDWVAESEDDLPETRTLEDVWDSMPEPAPPLIGTEEEGILRHGHKMLLAGPSKAGKSVLLMELALAVASGTSWCGYPCARGKVLYVNLEIDPASCYRRFREISGKLGLDRSRPGWRSRIDVWNLRGHAVPMDQLTPRLLHRASGKGYALVIIDPIYKVITGDENSASEMAAFCNQFDRVCSDLGAAVVYCHHHSKGQQGAKRTMDRASGSGVFARDPDAMLDLAPLELTDRDREEMHLGDGSPWRLTATLREFRTPPPVDLLFVYPRHMRDTLGELARLKIEGEDPFSKQRERSRKARAEQVMEDQQEKNQLVRDALAACAEDGAEPTREAVLERMAEFKGKAVTKGQIKRWTDPSRSPWAEFRATLSETGETVIEEA